ncbi:low molecular weight protein-tyrosine-phosphatase [Actinocorallia sp. A-T 12471]|uniref:low molecular weight protein-tyrosine-phosphatase n=1 Tax=Actinocorallia sp. A-T 12471 TaxID=3089813 RepID=UPI0029CFAC8B|nr:low molecular weight protein-tyrosine-phosphatase [Actinocorallia sp. A-T 12471]MDX6741840.1 low molecular weight protein-tyrosine-phosphatase [Actinocorallia sp. A-T 12471]
MTYRITFVCTGNICRSPMAEHVLRRHLADEGLDAEVDSSGTDGWHVGDPADRRTVRTLARHGYTSAHSARQFSAEWFAHYDLILALDEGHLRALRAMAPSAAALEKVRLLRSFDPYADDLNVPDPYYGGDAGFEECLALIEAAVPGLIDQVRKA